MGWANKSFSTKRHAAQDFNQLRDGTQSICLINNIRQYFSLHAASCALQSSENLHKYLQSNDKCAAINMCTASE